MNLLDFGFKDPLEEVCKNNLTYKKNNIKKDTQVNLIGDDN